MNLNFEKEKKKEKRRKVIKEGLIWLLEIAIVIGIAYLLVHVCFKKISTAGSAMEPTLYNGEEVFINKKAYLFFSPDREDVIAFYDKEGAEEEEDPFIIFRRVIGLPGETIQIIDGKIYIDGQEWKDSYTYNTMTTGGVAEEELTLGDDEYFVLCDSRIDSDDSRNASFGNVKKSQIVGKVSFRADSFSRVTGPDSKDYETEDTQE